jgi:hypothetical protein
MRMGLLHTSWKAEFQGHPIAVERSEVTRGITVSFDEQVIAKKAVTLIGLAELEGSAVVEGRPVPVHVSLNLGSECVIRVDGQSVEVTRTK